MIDFCSTTDAVTLTTDLDNVLQQIDMLLDTDNGEVLGDESYGTDLERYIWDLSYSTNAISRYVDDAIRSTCDLLGFNLRVSTAIFKGTANDIIVVNISLAKDGYAYTKTYNIK